MVMMMMKSLLVLLAAVLIVTEAKQPPLNRQEVSCASFSFGNKPSLLSLKNSLRTGQGKILFSNFNGKHKQISRVHKNDHVGIIFVIKFIEVGC